MGRVTRPHGGMVPRSGSARRDSLASCAAAGTMQTCETGPRAVPAANGPSWSRVSFPSSCLVDGFGVVFCSLYIAFWGCFPVP